MNDDNQSIKENNSFSNNNVNTTSLCLSLWINLEVQSTCRYKRIFKKLYVGVHKYDSFWLEYNTFYYGVC